MSAEWRPDDSLLDRDTTGETIGARRVRDALKKNRINHEGRVITSRDRGMAGVRRDLKRSTTLRGVQQWQLPILFDPNLVWIEARHRPGAKIPTHSHKSWVLHIVISGAMKYRNQTLKVGDWILVPPGQPYALEAASNPGAVTYYIHPSPPKG